MPLPTITLKPQPPDRRAHPWVYDNEITDGPPAGFEDGGLAQIKDAKGRILGVGYANRRSKIAVRYLTRRYDEAVNADFWRGRIQRALAYRLAHHAADGQLPSAYRLAHGEADGLPGLVVDVYGPYSVVQFLALGLESWREAIVSALTDMLPLSGIYERSDSPVRRLEGLDERAGVLWGGAPPDVLELEDDGATLLADLKGGAKTGLFLDQRENQLAAARQARGRDVLNCFAYTGLFGLRAALAGARSVTDVEISPAFAALGERQWARNSLSQPHEAVTGNVFDHLHTLDGEKYRTDMVILDPPAFTKNRASRESAARGYHEINRLALRLLRPGGVLVTCSCSHHLSAPEFRDIVHSAARDAGRPLRLIAQRGQPPDHPVLLDAPESEYLKCLIFAAET
ncbi:MAG: class I SAM-dependent rRNA methyltransferase [Armatimonadetes bacterium]|nr:class I SAM-dependent rRNA methyltransferase [Armatimonadota bacterium]